MKRIFKLTEREIIELIEDDPSFQRATKDDPITLAVDIDDTLIFWKPNFTWTYNGPLIDLLEKLKDKYGDKLFIMLWSKGGAKHAKDKASQIGYTKYDIAICKPFFTFDDLENPLEGSLNFEPKIAHI
jgi:hypothetical protein